MLSHVLNSQVVCKTTFPALKGAYPPSSRFILRSPLFLVNFYLFLGLYWVPARWKLCFFSQNAHFFVNMYRGVCVGA